MCGRQTDSVASQELNSQELNSQELNVLYFLAGS